MVPIEKADAKKSKSYKSKVVARSYYGNALSYAEESRNGPQRLFSSW